MPQDFNRRKRKRKPTITPRFGDNTLTLEIGLIRLAQESLKELEKEKKQ